MREAEQASMREAEQASMRETAMSIEQAPAVAVATHVAHARRTDIAQRPEQSLQTPDPTRGRMTDLHVTQTEQDEKHRALVQEIASGYSIPAPGQQQCSSADAGCASLTKGDLPFEAEATCATESESVKTVAQQSRSATYEDGAADLDQNIHSPRRFGGPALHAESIAERGAEAETAVGRAPGGSHGLVESHEKGTPGACSCESHRARFISPEVVDMRACESKARLGGSAAQHTGQGLARTR
eukprot:6178985-Pleurochrysis_carterae.AAC.1